MRWLTKVEPLLCELVGRRNKGRKGGRESKGESGNRQDAGANGGREVEREVREESGN